MTATPTASEPESLWFTFNDLSTRVPAPVREVGRAWMNGLLDAIGMFMNGRPATLVSVDEAVLWSSQLAIGYTVTDWLADADRDQKRLLMRIATKTGFPEEAGQALRDRFLLSEFLLTDDESPDAAADARALGMAFLLRGIAVSLPSEARWRETTIVLRHVWLDERGAELRDEVSVANLSGLEQHERVVSKWLAEAQHDLSGKPTMLAHRKSECFPHLRFGAEVDAQLNRLPAGLLSAVIGKLIVLDQASRAWRADRASTSPALPRCNPESEPTMQQYGDLRVFRDRAGVKRTYKLHAMVGSAYRIHLRILHESRALEIGYVGKHLPTSRHH